MPDSTYENLDPPSPPIHLEYGRRPPLAWIGRYRWRLVLLAVCIAVAVPVYPNWQPLKQRVLWLYWSHRAATFQMPGGIELVVTDPEQAKKLLATNPDFIPGDVPGSAVYQPLALRRLRQIDSRVEATGSNLGCQAVAFMGVMRRPDGEERLVILDGAMTTVPNLMKITLLFTVKLPSLFAPDPPTVSALAFTDRWWQGSLYSQYRPAELRGGVRDPRDPSHIVLEFVMRARPRPPSPFNIIPPPSASDHVLENEIAFRGTIDAYLQNDDSLKLKLRDAPPGYGRSSDQPLIDGNLLTVNQIQNQIWDQYSGR